jgi:SAM-dependent methyltransferase
MNNFLLCRIVRYVIRYFVGIARYTEDYARWPFILLRDRHIDKKLNIQTAETSSFQDEASLFQDGFHYYPTPYYVLEEIIGYLRPRPEDIFVDFGSGKGRVVFFMALQRLKKVIGVEINKELMDAAQENLKDFKLGNSPIEFILADASAYTIEDENIFFLFHPFGFKTLKKIIDNIKGSLVSRPRLIHIIYFNPAYRVFLDEQDWLILKKEIHNGGCLIWSNAP